MKRIEEQARRAAVRRVMAGQPVSAVAGDMDRSQPWVRKWVARYDPTDPGWASLHSRAPKTVANRTDAQNEESVLAVRKHLAQDPWAAGRSQARSARRSRLLRPARH